MFGSHSKDTPPWLCTPGGGMRGLVQMDDVDGRSNGSRVCVAQARSLAGCSLEDYQYHTMQSFVLQHRLISAQVPYGNEVNDRP